MDFAAGDRAVTMGDARDGMLAPHFLILVTQCMSL